MKYNYHYTGNGAESDVHAKFTNKKPNDYPSSIIS